MLENNESPTRRDEQLKGIKKVLKQLRDVQLKKTPIGQMSLAKKKLGRRGRKRRKK